MLNYAAGWLGRFITSLHPDANPVRSSSNYSKLLSPRSKRDFSVVPVGTSRKPWMQELKNSSIRVPFRGPRRIREAASIRLLGICRNRELERESSLNKRGELVDDVVFNSSFHNASANGKKPSLAGRLADSSVSFLAKVSVRPS